MPRGSGKTTLLIKESARTGKPIIVATGVDVQRIIDMAQEMNIKIPEPISAFRWINNRSYYRGSKLVTVDSFLIDDVDRVLATVFGGSIDKVTYTPKILDVPYLNMNGLKKSELENVLKKLKDYNKNPIVIGSQNLKENVDMMLKDMMDKYGYEIDSVDMCSDGTVIHFSKTIPTNAFISGCEIIMPNEIISNINVIAPEKVVEITFGDGTKEKMVCHENDTFDLRKCCFIAIAKRLYKKEYTQEGIEYMATQLTYQKKYVKIVDTALKAYAKKEKAKKTAEKERIEQEKITARQREKRRKYKERRTQRYREDMIDLIADSINEAKKRRKQSM